MWATCLNTATDNQRKLQITVANDDSVLVVPFDFLALPALQKCNRSVTFLSLSTCYFANVRFLTRSRLTHFWVAYVANRKHGAMFRSVSLVTEVTK